MLPEESIVAILTLPDAVPLTGDYAQRGAARTDLLALIRDSYEGAPDWVNSNAPAPTARLRPMVLASDDEFPFCAYEFTENPIPTMTGSASWQRLRIKIDCFATTYSEAMQIRRLLKTVLHNLAIVAGGVDFRPIRHVDGSDQDLTEPLAPGQEFRIFRLASDFSGLFRTT